MSSLACYWVSMMDAFTRHDLSSEHKTSQKVGLYKFHQLFRRHSRVGPTIEARAMNFEINACDVLGFPDARGFSISYGCAELLWYLAGLDQGSQLVPWSKHYEEKFAEDDGACWGAYGPRLFGDTRATNLLDLVAKELEATGYTRQAVLPILRPKDTEVLSANPRKKDFPCTMTFQFFVEPDDNDNVENLSMSVCMRSNDLWLGMPYDVFCFTQIQRLMAQRLNLRPTLYYHHAGSLHLYEPHHRAWRETKADKSPKGFASSKIFYDHTEFGTSPGKIFTNEFRWDMSVLYAKVLEYTMRHAVAVGPGWASEPPDFDDDSMLQGLISEAREAYGPIVSDCAFAMLSRRFTVDKKWFASEAIHDAVLAERKFRADSRGT